METHDTQEGGKETTAGETRAEAAYLMVRERAIGAVGETRRTDAKSNWTNVKIIDAQDAGQAAKPGAKLAEARDHCIS